MEISQGTPGTISSGNHFAHRSGSARTNSTSVNVDPQPQQVHHIPESHTSVDYTASAPWLDDEI
ncbi:hypothetical protein [Deinococcus marmoris]|uniref:Uncharacterized protein n=1 Tax=Deinococcus marmoris TaxID=249408 RepID=A0A1U7P4J1_9DEIO|nr:hypothetical protein [Deinococcus marmoris]OLV20083.1 hypothetical protein BOO71_0000850 [Deinococcus marmoris]